MKFYKKNNKSKIYITFDKIKNKYNPKIYFYKDGENFEKISKNRKCKKLIFILKGAFYNSIMCTESNTIIKSLTTATFYDCGIMAKGDNITIHNLTFIQTKKNNFFNLNKIKGAWENN